MAWFRESIVYTAIRSHLHCIYVAVKILLLFFQCLTQQILFMI